MKKPSNGIAKASPDKPASKPPVAKPAAPPAIVNAVPKKSNTLPPTGNLLPIRVRLKTWRRFKNPPLVVNPPQAKKLEADPTIKDPDQDTLKKAVPMVKKSIPIIVPKVLATRENELIKTIIINTNEISINIYDNGTVDHDTVSVYLDKKLVISKQMLTTSPINLKFTMDENDDVHELVMVAENEGDIPPNTSLMVVKAGGKEFEVRNYLH